MATKRIRRNMRVTNTFTAPVADAAEETAAVTIPREQVRAGDLISFEPVGRRRQARVTLRVVEMADHKAAHGYRTRAGATTKTHLPTRTYELPATVELIEPNGGNLT